jgi:prepilin-type N-terminal cleavage/methylation domain-containing protein
MGYNKISINFYMRMLSGKGFTLIEVLLVIAILAILASIVIIAINPAKQFASARDAQRESDVFAILNGLHQYALDHDGAFPENLTEEEMEICATGSESCENLLDLSPLTADQQYLVAMPVDPQCAANGVVCSENGTGYFVMLTTGGRVTVAAYASEGGEITKTR